MPLGLAWQPAAQCAGWHCDPAKAKSSKCGPSRELIRQGAAQVRLLLVVVAALVGGGNELHREA